MERRNRGSYACPLCRRQRRRCDGSCEFGQYFPAHRSDDFDNALRLFGLSNIMKFMRDVELHQRQDTANSILAEGTAWRNHPVRGVLGYELILNSQINSSLKELEVTNQLLAFCRDQAIQANQNMQMDNSLFSSSIPSQSNQIDGSHTQMPSLGETPTGYMGGINLMEPYKLKAPSTHENGESSTVAFKEETIVEEQKLKTSDEGENITLEEDKEAKDYRI